MRNWKLFYALALIALIAAGSIRQNNLNMAVTGSVDRPIYLVPTSERAVALTFDISWGEKSPGPILDILKAENVQATFFLSGPWAKSHPELANRIKEDGHELASHGHRHIDYSPLPTDTIKAEVRLAQEEIESVTGVKITYIRTPNGDYDEEAIAAIREVGQTAVLWSLDSKDWLNPGVDSIVNQVLNGAHRGAIILMHASDTCNQTHVALPRILSGLRDQGYQLKTVGGLISDYQNRKPPLAP